MDYNLERIKGILKEYHPKFGDMGFYYKDSCEVIEDLSVDGQDFSIVHPKRMGINILGRPEVNVEDIQGFCDTMKYMGLKPYYWDYDKWGMLFFEFEMKMEDNINYD